MAVTIRSITGARARVLLGSFLLLAVHATSASSQQSSLADDQAIQAALVIANYDVGGIDGTISPSTKRALANYFRDRPNKSDARRELARRAALVSALRQQSFEEPSSETVARLSIRVERLFVYLGRQGLLAGEATGSSTGREAAATQPAPPAVRSWPPHVAENGDVRGRDNDGDGRSEPVHVRGYYRKDGTYVRGHYRAKPRR